MRELTGDPRAELGPELAAGLESGQEEPSADAERSAWIRDSRKCLVFCLLAMMESASTPGKRRNGCQTMAKTNMKNTLNNSSRHDMTFTLGRQSLI